MISFARASRRGPGGNIEIDVPDDPMHFWLNFTLRVGVLFIYGFFLFWTVYNIINYLVIKKRYKEFAIILYYTFFFALFVARIVQTIYEFEVINDHRVKNCIVASDGFSVVIGLTQVLLIGDLIISLQCFEQQAQFSDRDSTVAIVGNPATQYAEIDKRTECKRSTLQIVIGIMVTGILAEILIRIIVGYEYPFIILNSELIVLGCILAFETYTFISLSRRIFEGDFEEEQRFFKVSLAVFLSTYALRCTLLLFIIFLWDTYVQWFENLPLFAATIQAICNMTYDALPVVHIMMRHKKIFEVEEKQTTEVVMSTRHGTSRGDTSVM